MGFQWLLLAATQNTLALDPPTGQFDAYNLSIPLEFTSDAKTSVLFESASVEVMTILAKENVTMNNHHYGLYPDHFNSINALQSFYKVISLNHDRQGVPFVSTIEAFKYPIFGLQWHPEKNPFE